MGQEIITDRRVLGERSTEILNSLGDKRVFDVPPTLLDAWYNNIGICKISPEAPKLVVEKPNNPGSVTVVQVRDGEKDRVIAQMDLAPGEVLGVTIKDLGIWGRKPHLTRSLRRADLDFLTGILDATASNNC